MWWNLSKVRAMVCPRRACVLVILLAAAAGPALAQPEIPDQVYDLGRIGLSQLAILRSSMIHRPIDEFSGRPGGDALGMGGAHIASASGAAALGWNPAGLADLEHLSFSFDGYSRSASGSVADFPESLVIPQLSTLRFLDYRTSLKGGFIPNFIGAGAPLWTSGERRLVAAFGWRHGAEVAMPEQRVSELAVGVGGGTFPVVFSFDRTEKGSLEAFSPTLAFRAGPTLSLGAALNVLDGGVRANTDERFTFVGSPLRGSVRARNRYSGLSAEFGGRVGLGPRVSFGVRLVAGHTLKVRDGTFYSRSIAPPGTPRIVLLATLADYDLTIPAAFGAGVALRPTPRLLVAADMNSQSWSKAKVAYKKYAQGLVEQAPPDSMGLPLADVTTLHLGAEYTLLRTRWGEVPIRAGFRTAPQGYLDPDPRDVRVDTLETGESWATSTRHYNGTQPKANAYSFGVSLDTPGIRYDLGVESFSYENRKWFFEEPYNPITNPGRSMVNVKQKVSKIRLSATYTF
jgi:hypothetical protein